MRLDVDLQAGDHRRLRPGDSQQVATSPTPRIGLADRTRRRSVDEAEDHGGEVRPAEAEFAGDVPASQAPARTTALRCVVEAGASVTEYLSAALRKGRRPVDIPVPDLLFINGHLCTFSDGFLSGRYHALVNVSSPGRVGIG